MMIKLVVSNAAKRTRIRLDILCTMETAEERQKGEIHLKGEVPLLKALEIILVLILPSPRDRQGCCGLHCSYQ